MKLLAADFPGNRRTKVGEIFRQIFATFFAHVGEKFRQSFALGAFRHKLFFGFMVDPPPALGGSTMILTENRKDFK